MARAQKITLEQIESARKILQGLPAKELGRSKEDAAYSLVKDIQAALKKGYRIKEISNSFKQDGILISASVIKKSLEGVTKKTRKKTDIHHDNDAKLSIS